MAQGTTIRWVRTYLWRQVIAALGMRCSAPPDLNGLVRLSALVPLLHLIYVTPISGGLLGRSRETVDRDVGPMGRPIWKRLAEAWAHTQP